MYNHWRFLILMLTLLLLISCTAVKSPGNLKIEFLYSSWHRHHFGIGYIAIKIKNVESSARFFNIVTSSRKIIKQNYFHKKLLLGEDKKLLYALKPIMKEDYSVNEPKEDWTTRPKLFALVKILYKDSYEFKKHMYIEDYPETIEEKKERFGRKGIGFFRYIERFMNSNMDWDIDLSSNQQEIYDVFENLKNLFDTIPDSMSDSSVCSIIDLFSL